MKVINILVAGKEEKDISKLSKQEREAWSRRLNEEAMKQGNYSRKQS